MDRLGPWRRDRQVAVAVSGGPDSLCLARLAAGWGRPTALVVDHGLRTASASEASLTLERLASFGLPATLLRLEGLTAGPALAARARQARYRALLGACAAIGLTDLLLGHHCDDQAETIFMRAARNSPADASGLAGMAALTYAGPARLVRPLLGQPKSRLLATLSVAGLGWVEDPSNQSVQAERGRVRRRLAQQPDLAEALLTDAATQAARRDAREQRTADWLAAHAVLRPEGYALIPGGPLPPAALAGLLRVVGGRDYAPASTAVARLAASPRPATLGGVRLLPAGRLGAGLLLVREPAAIAPPVAASPGACWDGRFRLGAAGLPGALTLGGLGDDARRLRCATSLPAAVLRGLPALRRKVTVVAVPHIGYYAEPEWADLRLQFASPAPVCGAWFAGGVGLLAEGVPNGTRDPTFWLEDEPDFCPDELCSVGVVRDRSGD